jgi:hypothetical protein
MSTNTSVSQTAESNPFSVLGEALEAAAESVGDARSDASASAKVAAAKVQSGVTTGAYYAAYGVSYGLVFSGVFLKELLPANNVVRRGFEDGAEAAIDAAARLHAAEDLDDEETDDADDAPPSVEARKPS